MLQRVSGTAGQAATSSAGQSASEKSLTVQSESEENAWFATPAQQLLGSDPGFALHIVTEKAISESSGYRYVSGERAIPINIFRQMVHSPQGRVWFSAFMEGCTAEWWIELKRHQRMGAAADSASQ